MLTVSPDPMLAATTPGESDASIPFLESQPLLPSLSAQDSSSTTVLL